MKLTEQELQKLVLDAGSKAANDAGIFGLNCHKTAAEITAFFDMRGMSDKDCHALNISLNMTMMVNAASRLMEMATTFMAIKEVEQAELRGDPLSVAKKVADDEFLKITDAFIQTVKKNHAQGMDAILESMTNEDGSYTKAEEREARAASEVAELLARMMQKG